MAAFIVLKSWSHPRVDRDTTSRHLLCVVYVSPLVNNHSQRIPALLRVFVRCDSLLGEDIHSCCLCLSVCAVCLCLCVVSICLSILCVYLSVVSICLSVLSICSSVRLSVYLFVCHVCLSVLYVDFTMLYALRLHTGMRT